ncbi:hypothetical protein RZS08_41335, partial [Arthrospira platensis SPKY1]|nr:hypothetical protein [Arthrospira platensis SPKY1]
MQTMDVCIRDPGRPHRCTDQPPRARSARGRPQDGSRLSDVLLLHHHPAAGIAAFRAVIVDEIET